MPKITSIEDLRLAREEAQEILELRKKTRTQIIVGMGTCGIAAGARETRRAVLEELGKRGIDADVKSVGCIGMCTAEPLVDIVEAGKNRITYGGVTEDRVPQLIEDHLVKHGIVDEWVVGQIEMD